MFLRYATAGALLWAGAWITLGYLCSDVIRSSLETLALAGPLLIAIGAAPILYVGFKYDTRRRVFRQPRKARIDPVEPVSVETRRLR